MVGSTHTSITREEILKEVSEADIIGFYFGVKSIPTLISSPLRKDSNPSFALYSPDGKDINYLDHATGEKGGTFTLLMKYFGLSREEVYAKVRRELISKNVQVESSKKSRKYKTKIKTVSELKCKIRPWQQHDIDYWESYGVTLPWLKWANVHPISHIIYEDNVSKSVIATDRYAYAFAEFKEGKTTLKIYQPRLKDRKWRNSHDKSVLGLWSKLPAKGKSVCICSSVKDALCLMSNMQIPCICVQGERMPVSATAMGELRKRFEDIYCCYDNDKAGIEDAKILCTQYSLINMEIPKFEGGKDISDYYHTFGKEEFKRTFRNLIIESRASWWNDLPF